ncbi:hypothetical protein TWF694_007038 [Orbilia ellipsospora]|uniref:Uncharacterized protein n=1 Tax=Orbilia ellipsospora TaxID=2528407 RepID=A0AAV9XMD5_9PEZI
MQYQILSDNLKDTESSELPEEIIRKEVAQEIDLAFERAQRIWKEASSKLLATNLTLKDFDSLMPQWER